MLKTAPIIIIVLMIVLGGGYFVLRSQSTPSIAPEDTQLVREENSDIGKENISDQILDKRYIEYSSNSLNETAQKRRVLFFYASWCPTCRPADASFKAQESQIPADLVLIRVNYNDPDTDTNEKALAQKYQVTYQHTFVQIDENGNELTKWNGGQIEELLENIR